MTNDQRQDYHSPLEIAGAPDLKLVSKLPEVGTTIFTVMSRLANECGAINLSQGFPDFACPAALVDEVTRAMREGHNQYPPMAGIEPLRQAIARKIETLYGVRVDPETEVTVVSGATEGLYNAITAAIRPGDEAIIFDPAYDSYDPVIRLAGGSTRRIAMRYPEYAIDWDEVEDSVSPRTRLIIVNSPHNPSGAILRAADMQALSGIANRHDLCIISDEVYEHIIFDGEQHQGVLRYPALRERSFAIFSFGKTYHATGWKVGYCVAPPALTTEYRKIHQFNTFTTCTPMQHALARFMENSAHYLGLPAFYQAKRDHLRETLRDSRLRALPCSGTYFQLFDYSAISDEGDYDFAQRLTREHGVAVIPVSVFHGDGADHKVIRVCFAKHEATLDRAAAILRRL
jgi:methionine aminotransferase